MTIYELYGRLTEERHREHAAHLATLEVLRKVVEGELPVSAVTVDGDTWKLVPHEVKQPGA